MYYEFELIDNVLGYVIEQMEVEEIIIPDDWDI